MNYDIKPPWIKFSERLPNKDDVVVIFYDSNLPVCDPPITAAKSIKTPWKEIIADNPHWLAWQPAPELPKPVHPVYAAWDRYFQSRTYPEDADTKSFREGYKAALL